jgi:hypothetical protein
MNESRGGRLGSGDEEDWVERLEAAARWCHLEELQNAVSSGQMPVK